MSEHDLASMPPDDVTDRGAEAVPVSAVPGVFWPSLPDPKRVQVLAIAAFLEKTQWWPAEILRTRQFEQLAALIDHAVRTVPFYRKRLRELQGVTGLDLAACWGELPILRKSDIQISARKLLSRKTPPDHGGLRDVSTSGSTGEPVTVKKTALAEMFQSAIQWRDHQWHRRDIGGTVCVIRRLDDQTHGLAAADQAAGWAPGYATGGMYFSDVAEPLDHHLDWLARLRPDYLMTYPSYLKVLISRAEERGIRLESLREVATSGEICGPEISALCRKVWTVPLSNIYGAQEVGKIGLQHANSDGYFVQSEVVLVEVIDEEGKPCAPGNIGRVIVTPLHSFAMPLIRYDLGDYAEVGAPSSCGRGLPVLRHVVGRVRNMVTLANGVRKYPRLTGSGLESIAALRQFQLIQKTVDDFELHVVLRGPMTEDIRQSLRTAVDSAIGQAVNVRIIAMDDIPRDPSGKFEDVKSYVVP